MKQVHPAVELTSDLVRINSENPTHDEEAIVEFICRWLERESISYEKQLVEPNRYNIIAKVPGKGVRKSIALIAHCDTVPVGEGWGEDPFGGIIKDGRLYGRGSADMKAGLAAALYALKYANTLESIPGDFIVAVSVDEEGPGMKGVMELIKSGFIDESTMVIAPEPTSLNIIRAHRGVMWYDITTYGKSSHGGHAERGVDAIHALAEVICELKSTVNSLQFDEKPLISIGKIKGGEKTNVVPDKAQAEIDFRVVFPMNTEDANSLVKNAASRAISNVTGARVDVKNLGLQRPPVETPQNAHIIQLLESCYRKVLNDKPTLGGYVAYTDAAVVSLKLNNKNAICFGPGNLEQAHKPDEWVSVQEIIECAEIFKELSSIE